MRRALVTVVTALSLLGCAPIEGENPENNPTALEDQTLDDNADGVNSEPEALDYTFDNFTSSTTGASIEQGNPELVAWANEWSRRMFERPDLDPYSPPVLPPPYALWPDGLPPPMDPAPIMTPPV